METLTLLRLLWVGGIVAITLLGVGVALAVETLRAPASDERLRTAEPRLGRSTLNPDRVG
jgi:hypothetical protein